MSKVINAVGARPNFVKMAPVIEALGETGRFTQVVVHTGQHYDARLSDEVISDVGFPLPDRFLGIGSGTHAEQTGRTLIAFEEVLREERPDLVIVAGDVNATLACALAAAKLAIPIAHVEAGLRSFDWTMPEEINRVIVDRLSDFLFTHSPEAAANLQREGIPEKRIHYVGNTMVDSLRRWENRAARRAYWNELGLCRGEYVLVTLHRPANVDDEVMLSRIVAALSELSRKAQVVFPLHPRTRSQLERDGGIERLTSAGARCLEPLGYLDFLSLQVGAGVIVTDSGGVQEEASALGAPCYTLRPNTERPITITHGTNELLGEGPEAILGICLTASPRPPCRIPLWDGRAGERVAAVLAAAFGRAPAAAKSIAHD